MGIICCCGDMNEQLRRMSVIGTSRMSLAASQPMLNREEKMKSDEKLEDLVTLQKEEIKKLKQTLKQREEELSNVKEEIVLCKEEYSAIVNGLLNTVQSKSEEVNRTRSILQESR